MQFIQSIHLLFYLLTSRSNNKVEISWTDCVTANDSCLSKLFQCFQIRKWSDRLKNRSPVQQRHAGLFHTEHNRWVQHRSQYRELHQSGKTSAFLHEPNNRCEWKNWTHSSSGWWIRRIEDHNFDNFGWFPSLFIHSYCVRIYKVDQFLVTGYIL